MKIKGFVVLMICLLFVFTLSACNSNEATDDKTSNEIVNGEVGEKTENSENVVLSQSISKDAVGLTMELTGEYSDCIVKDLEESEYKVISDKAIAGFNISKVVDGKEYVLSSVAVVDNSATSTSEDRAKFPYIFAGSTYSVVATLPSINVEDSAVYEKVTSLQAGIMQQLCTIFFDESVLTTSSNTSNESNAVVVETENSETVSSTSDIALGLEEVENTEVADSNSIIEGEVNNN